MAFWIFAETTTPFTRCLEFVKHRVNGIVVSAGDPEKLALAVAHLLDNPAERRRLGKRARETVRGEFDQEAVFARTHRVYESLLGVAAIHS